MVIGPYCIQIEGSFRDSLSVAKPLTLTWGTNKWRNLTRIRSARIDQVLDQQVISTPTDLIGWVACIKQDMTNRALEDLLTIFCSSLVTDPAGRAKKFWAAYSTLVDCGWQPEQIENRLAAALTTEVLWTGQGDERDVAFPIEPDGYEAILTISPAGPLMEPIFEHRWSIPGIDTETQPYTPPALGAEDLDRKAFLIHHYLSTVASSMLIGLQLEKDARTKRGP